MSSAEFRIFVVREECFPTFPIFGGCQTNQVWESSLSLFSVPNDFCQKLNKFSNSILASSNRPCRKRMIAKLWRVYNVEWWDSPKFFIFHSSTSWSDKEVMLHLNAQLHPATRHCCVVRSLFAHGHFQPV